MPSGSGENHTPRSRWAASLRTVRLSGWRRSCTGRRHARNSDGVRAAALPGSLYLAQGHHPELPRLSLRAGNTPSSRMIRACALEIFPSASASSTGHWEEHKSATSFRERAAEPCSQCTGGSYFGHGQRMRLVSRRSAQAAPAFSAEIPPQWLPLSWPAPCIFMAVAHATSLSTDCTMRIAPSARQEGRKRKTHCASQERILPVRKVDSRNPRVVVRDVGLNLHAAPPLRNQCRPPS